MCVCVCRSWNLPTRRSSPTEGWTREGLSLHQEATPRPKGNKDSPELLLRACTQFYNTHLKAFMTWLTRERLFSWLAAPQSSSHRWRPSCRLFLCSSALVRCPWRYNGIATVSCLFYWNRCWGADEALSLWTAATQGPKAFSCVKQGVDCRTVGEKYTGTVFFCIIWT